jgi:hypothetical protein
MQEFLDSISLQDLAAAAGKPTASLPRTKQA